ncbi:MAG: hypothetical protein LKF88_03295 [Microbacteriaceae bacterium]|jgi:hypothetical protein|nr:hypothetical protein [Microbacteriaceae bacterium]
MARDHWLPAALIGRFSEEAELHSRNRHITVYRKGKSTPYIARALAIGYANGLYDVPDHSAGSIDDVWKGIEEQLPQVFSEVSAPGVSTVDGRIWLRVLVPFVASLFVRGVEFNERYTERMEIGFSHLGDLDSDPDLRAVFESSTGQTGLNLARLMELQRILAPIMVGQWHVATITGGYKAISNDLGFFPTQDQASGYVGMAIPIGPTTILAVFPRARNTILSWDGTRWVHPLYWHEEAIPLGPPSGPNEAVASVATQFVFGPDLESVAGVHPMFATKPGRELLADMWENTGIALPANEQQWQKAIYLTSEEIAPDALRRSHLTDAQGVLQFSEEMTQPVVEQGWWPGVEHDWSIHNGAINLLTLTPTNEILFAPVIHDGYFGSLQDRGGPGDLPPIPPFI